jgi:hypothetical protein
MAKGTCPRCGGPVILVGPNKKGMVNFKCQQKGDDPNCKVNGYHEHRKKYKGKKRGRKKGSKNKAKVVVLQPLQPLQLSAPPEVENQPELRIVEVEEIHQQSAPSSQVSSEPVTAPQPDAFDQVARDITETVGQSVPDDPGQVLPPEGSGDPQPVQQFAIPEKLFRTLLPHIGHAMATGFKKPELAFIDYEIDLFAPALKMVADRRLPEWLAKSASPDMAMLGLAIMVYAVRVGLGPLLDKLWEQISTETGTSTADSAESQEQSETPAPGKPSASSSSFRIPSV